MHAAEPNAFFRQSRTFTEVKLEILGKYFENWCDIRLKDLPAGDNREMLFVDMHAGEQQCAAAGAEPEIEGSRSLYKTIIKKQALRAAVRTYLYNRDKAVLEHTSGMLTEFAQEAELSHLPVPLENTENKALLAEGLATGAPALVFMDPFQNSYTQQVLLQAVTVYCPDLFMLLCPENIIKTLAARKVNQALSALFGEYLPQISNYSRKEKDKYKVQKYILSKFECLLHEKGNFTLLFKANQPDMEQPEHYILFSSPHSHVYKAFKETILPYTTTAQDGVPVFRANQYQNPQTALFGIQPKYTLAKLEERLVQQASQYKYKSIDKIYTLDNPNTNYSRENYIAVFDQLRREGKVELLNASTMQTIRKATPSAVVKFR